MKRHSGFFGWSAALLLVSAASCHLPVVRQPVEAAPPIPVAEVIYRLEVFRNEGLTAFLLELPPRHATLMHRHDRDILSVFVNGGRTTATFYGQPPRTDSIPLGDVRFRPAGFTHPRETTE